MSQLRFNASAESQHLGGDAAPDAVCFCFAAEHTHICSCLASNADAVVSCSVAMGTSSAKLVLIGDQKLCNPLKVLKHKVTITQTADA